MAVGGGSGGGSGGWGSCEVIKPGGRPWYLDTNNHPAKDGQTAGSGGGGGGVIFTIVNDVSTLFSYTINSAGGGAGCGGQASVTYLYV